MNLAQQYKAYQNNQVQTVSPEKLVTMLYDGAIKFVNLAIDGVKEKNLEKSNTNFIKAQNIINELMQNLNMDAGDISQNLYSLYDFMYNHLVDANINKDIKKADEVINLMYELRETWVIAIKQKN